MAYTMKTYNDSYLYKTKILKSQKDNPSTKANAAIKDFIISSHRIEAKNTDAFRGVAEDIKRSQRFSALYTMLMSDDVKLCIGDSEMPRAFKVFDAKDPKNSLKPTVFIDVTGLIEFKNGYYNCRKIDVLLAYLFDAMIYKLYRFYPNKILDNSSITLAATECYVSLFEFIIDYQRIIGFSANKNKISYLTALFFLHHMMGKDLEDNYTKTIAAKVAGISQSDIRAYDLYTNENDTTFLNIAEFINYISETFNLKGFNLQVFVTKWMYLFGTGTEYGCELYTSFMVLIANAYSGSYIVQQRQIERACKTAMVKTCLELERVGANIFNYAKPFRESYENEIHEKTSMELAKSISLRENERAILHIEESDFHVAEAAKEIAERGIKYCNEANVGDRRTSNFASKVIETGIKSAYKSSYDAITNEEFQYYENGTLIEAVKVLSKSLSDRQRDQLVIELIDNANKLRELIRESESDKEFILSASEVVKEMIEITHII